MATDQHPAARQARKLTRTMSRLQQQERQVAAERSQALQELRRDGWSWDAIASLLGISRQGAIRIGNATPTLPVSKARKARSS